MAVTNLFQIKQQYLEEQSNVIACHSSLHVEAYLTEGNDTNKRKDTVKPSKEKYLTEGNDTETPKKSYVRDSQSHIMASDFKY